MTRGGDRTVNSRWLAAVYLLSAHAALWQKTIGAVGNGAEDGVRRTEFGLVRRLSTPFPDKQEQGMQMQ